METKKEIKVMDAFCPHCKKSFIENGVIVNHFNKDDNSYKVLATMTPGHYGKKIIDNKENSIKVLENNELVIFFCQHCHKELNLNDEKTIFQMDILTEYREEMKVFRSAMYGEEFTVIIDDKNFYNYGRDSKKEFIDQILEHYNLKETFLP